MSLKFDNVDQRKVLSCKTCKDTMNERQLVTCAVLIKYIQTSLKQGSSFRKPCLPAVFQSSFLIKYMWEKKKEQGI